MTDDKVLMILQEEKDNLIARRIVLDSLELLKTRFILVWYLLHMWDNCIQHFSPLFAS